MTFRQTIKKVVVGSPFEPLARWADYALARNKNWLYDRQTIEVMRRVLRRDSWFIDVGAHKGDILRQAVGLAPEGKHWAFEPLPDLCAKLKAEFTSANVFNVALSDSRGIINDFIYIPDMPARSGMKRTPFDSGHEVKKIPVEKKHSIASFKTAAWT